MRLHEDVMRVLTIKVDAHEDGPSVQMQKRTSVTAASVVIAKAVRRWATATAAPPVKIVAALTAATVATVVEPERT